MATTTDANWEDNVKTEGDVSITEDSGTLTATSALGDSPDLPVVVEPKESVSTFYNYDASISGSGSYTSDTSSPVNAIFKYLTTNGGIQLSNTGDLTWNLAKIAAGDLLMGSALLYSHVKNAVDENLADGSTFENTINHSGQITVNSTANFEDGMTSLPLVSDLAGILAASTGWSYDYSGAVGVTTESGSSIDVSSKPADSSKPIVAAGVMALARVADEAPDAFDAGITITHGGDLTVESDQGVGLYGSLTVADPMQTQNVDTEEGATKTVAVDVTLKSSGSIQTTGKTGIGVFAVNQTYLIGNPDDPSPTGTGAVSVTLENGSKPLSTGGSGSLFSTGVLAISSGNTDGIVPFGEIGGINANGPDVGGKIDVNSDRVIQTEGELSAGIAAISSGVAMVGSTSSDDTTGSLGSMGASVTGASGEKVTVKTTSNGTITTLGKKSVGILASSISSGGIVFNNIDQSLSGDSFLQGLNLGNPDDNSNSAATGATAGPINVEFAAKITTGDGNGKGIASAGILAQSIGGGGGSAGGKASAFVGDAGGNGGDGGFIHLTQWDNGSIVTNDHRSPGIIAHSIGGGGGEGGNADGFFVAVGGRGGLGGDGAKVELFLNDSISTSGDYSGGAILQSIGGGGGHAGSASSFGLFSLDVAVGGTGGGGGDGGKVEATSYGAAHITTVGEDSTGILAHSVGGGGGHGGHSTSIETGTLISLNLAVGGSGGDGGFGNDVNVKNYGTITTGDASHHSGGNSAGIIAQSVGGGGGHGGSAHADSFNVDAVPDVPNVNATLSFGGTGGSGGDGGDVTLSNTGSVTTHGDQSVGVLGQSVGGGGGSGGKASLLSRLINIASDGFKVDMAFGGQGEGGGSGGAVSASNGSEKKSSSVIETTGGNSAGMVIQSVGGGGGHGGHGDIESPTEDWSKSEEEEASTLQFNLTLGGSGGSGGFSGEVTGENYGSVKTQGESSPGISAQSIGGGGGAGKGGSADGGNTKTTINVTAGGGGGDGGVGDDVTVNNHNSIHTKGGDSVGILAQSIGGGGGDAGKSESSSNLDRLDQGISLVHPENAWTADIAVGGQGGGGNGSGVVSVTNEQGATITTEGSRSFAIHAQSISGGGGRGGAASTQTNAAYNSAFTQKSQYTFQLSLGGSGGSSDTPGDLNVDNDGEITTSGYEAHGIFAQSIAGGGGAAGSGSMDIGATDPGGTPAMSLGIPAGGGSGSGGAGGDVSVSTSNSISTTGMQASGILAQSIGGGGGHGSAGSGRTSGPTSTVDPFDVPFSAQLGTNQTSDSTDGGTVSVYVSSSTTTNNPTISTTGDWAFGVLGQSVGAGGGKASFISGTTSKAVTKVDSVTLGALEGEGAGGDVSGNMSQNSKVSTSGYGAMGIVLQSVGAGGGIVTLASQDYKAGNGEDADQEVNLGSGWGDSTATTEGDGGVVGFHGESTVSTQGDFAHGVLLQSVAGGGGIFGAGTDQAPTHDDEARRLRVSMGGPDNPDGTGGEIQVGLFNQISATITTEGSNAFGLVAQSVGGGGGMAMGSFIDTQPNMGAYSEIKAKRFDGGAVSINLDDPSSITTHGEGAHGIVAQSVGGGGGILQPGANAHGLRSSVGVYADNAHGYGGDVYVLNSAPVETHGDGAIGIVAQVIGGGGGLWADLAGSVGNENSSTSGSSNGTLEVDVYGSITTHGSKGHGVFAQNMVANGNPGNDITVNVFGTIKVNAENGIGVRLSGGTKHNKLTILSGGVIDANRPYTHTENSHKLDVENNGIMSGSIGSESGEGFASIFNNYGLFYAGMTVEAIVNNYADLLVGTLSDTDAGIESTFGGEFNQSADGLLHFDVFGLGDHDALVLSDTVSSMSLEGAYKVVFHEDYNPEIGHEFAILRGLEVDSLGENFLESLQVEGLDGFDVIPSLSSDFSSLNLLIAAVPEPSQYGLITGLLGLMLAVARRRR